MGDFHHAKWRINQPTLGHRYAPMSRSFWDARDSHLIRPFAQCVLPATMLAFSWSLPSQPSEKAKKSMLHCNASLWAHELAMAMQNGKSAA